MCHGDLNLLLDGIGLTTTVHLVSGDGNVAFVDSGVDVHDAVC